MDTDNLITKKELDRASWNPSRLTFRLYKGRKIELAILNIKQSKLTPYKGIGYLRENTLHSYDTLNKALENAFF